MRGIQGLVLDYLCFFMLHDRAQARNNAKRNLQPPTLPEVSADCPGPLTTYFY